MGRLKEVKPLSVATCRHNRELRRASERDVSMASPLKVCFVAILLLGCARFNQTTQPPSAALQATCRTAGRAVDSTYVVAQAQRVLMRQGYSLLPGSFQPIRIEGVEVGILVSLVPVSERPVIGVGGLVWVDVDTGCPVVLRRYE